MDIYQDIEISFKLACHLICISLFAPTAQLSTQMDFIRPHIEKDDYYYHRDKIYSCIQDLPGRSIAPRRVRKRDTRLYGCPPAMSIGPLGGGRRWRPKQKGGHQKATCSDLFWKCLDKEGKVVGEMCIGYNLADDRTCQTQQSHATIMKRCLSHARETSRAVATDTECGVREDELDDHEEWFGWILFLVQIKTGFRS